MRLGSKAKLTIGVGLVAAAVFGILGVRDLMRSAAEPQAASKDANVTAKPAETTVLLAATTRAIRTGETITADMIRNAPFDPARVPAGATVPAEVIGEVATRDIPPNMLIPRSALGKEQKLAIRVPVGMRAVSIDTTAEIAVAGLVRPGDRVDVQVVYPGEDAISGARGNGSSRARTLLQMVPVLAVGDLVVGTPPAPQGTAANVAAAAGTTPEVQQTGALPARTVTLALTPMQVGELSLAKNVGVITLSLRNPDDHDQVEVAQIASSPIRASVPAMPPPIPIAAPAQQAAAPVRPVRRAPQSRPIELVVGGNREVIYSGSGAR